MCSFFVAHGNLTYAIGSHHFSTMDCSCSMAKAWCVGLCSCQCSWTCCWKTFCSWIFGIQGAPCDLSKLCVLMKVLERIHWTWVRSFCVHLILYMTNLHLFVYFHFYGSDYCPKSPCICPLWASRGSHTGFVQMGNVNNNVISGLS